MRRNEKGSAGVFAAIMIALLVFGILAFIWEYNTVAPWLPGSHNSWSDGLVHGAFAVPNFIVNVINGQAQMPLYATGGSGWYNFWYLVGIGALFGSSSSSSRRSNT